jgi:hypothetical protein
MALVKKLSLRKVAASADEEPAAEAAPKKVLKGLKPAKPEPEEEPELPLEEEQEQAPPAKKVLTKKVLGSGPAKKAEPEPEEEPEEEAEAEETEDDEVPEEQAAEAPKKSLAVKKKAAAPEARTYASPAEAAEAEGKTREVVAYSPSSMGTIDGEIDSRDLMRPRIQLVQANSTDLEERGFTVGQIALNGELLIWDKGCDPLELTLLTGRKKYQQKLTDEEYKEGSVPLIFDSKEDAAEAGFNPEWDGDEPPQVDPVLYCLFLLKQPDFIEPDPLFNLEFDDEKYVMAEMKFSGVNMRTPTSGKWLITQTRTSLAPDSRMFNISMVAAREKQKTSGNIVTVAQFKNLGRHKNPEFFEFVKTIGA